MNSALKTDLLTIVPARAGSKRLPGKNLKALGNLSLLGWTARTARQAGISGPVVLSTEAAEVAEEGKRHGLDVPFMRPAELATDETGSLPVVLHALDWFTAAFGREPEVVMLLQVTSPFRTPDMIRDGLAMLAAEPDAEGLIAVTPSDGTVTRHDVCLDGNWLRPAPPGTPAPRQVPSGALYLTKPGALRQQGRFVPARCLGLVHSGITALDIDTDDDWAAAEHAIGAGLIAVPQ